MPLSQRGDAGLVVDYLGVGRGHEGYHAHGEELVDVYLVRDEAGYQGLTVIAVLHVVPAEPGHGIEPEPEVPGLAYHDAAGALAAPDGAGLVVLPEPEDDGGLLARVLVGVHELLVGVLLDGLPLGAAEAAGPLAQGVGVTRGACEDVGLALDVPVGGVAEADAGVLHYLGDDGAVPPVAGVGVRVPPGVGGAVAVHGGVAHVLLEQPGELVVLKERLELGVDDVGGALQAPVARAGRAGASTGA